ncbi:hypothetical protein BaRGS_00019189 [Batillaria attramentaria]|uniref:Uncharacterized protein n=1 Tax=Batillaria attramentaria TaxID=370345 RepID=A0ABD0KMQ5_9CAEN
MAAQSSPPPIPPTSPAKNLVVRRYKDTRDRLPQNTPGLFDTHNDARVRSTVALDQRNTIQIQFKHRRPAFHDKRQPLPDNFRRISN